KSAPRSSFVALAGQSRHPGEGFLPRGGGVLWTVRRTFGVVHEAVLPTFDQNDLAVVATRPRVAEIVDVVHWRERVVRPEEREGRTHLGRDGKRFDAVTGTVPALRRAHHPVERNRGVEPVGGGRLEHVVPAHAETEHG